MSTLSKVFVILVLLVAVMKLGVDVALFAHRVDWKDKFIKEVNWNYVNQQNKNAEIDDLQLQVDNWKAYNGILFDKANLVDIENSSKSAQIAALQRQLDATDGNFKRLIADVDAYVRQLEVQNAQLTAMTERIEEYRQRLSRAKADQSSALTELMYARQEAEVLQKSLADLEAAHVGLAREKKRLDETMKALHDRGVDTELVTPAKTLEGKVRAVSPEIGLVVLSIGGDDGVKEGNEFTIYRTGQFVAKITIDRVTRTWSAGRVTLKKEDPRVADDASNSIFVSSFKSNGKE